MDLIDTNNATFGFDQPGCGSQGFSNGFANLDADGPFNASNGFNYYETPELLSSFDEYFSSIPLEGFDQSSFDNPNSSGVGDSNPAASLNHSTQQVFSFNNSGLGNSNSTAPASHSAQPISSFDQSCFGNFNPSGFHTPNSSDASNSSSTTTSNRSTQGISSFDLSGFGDSNSTTPASHSAQSVSGLDQSCFGNSNSSGFHTTNSSDARNSNSTISANHSTPQARFSQSSLDNSNSTASVNRSSQPVTNNLPVHAPHRQVTYDPSIEIPYTLEDTDADKIRKWENLIARANLANAGMPHPGTQIIEEEAVGQCPQVADSPDSLFDAPRSPSVEIIETTSPTPPTPSPPQAPALTMIPSKAATNVTATAIPRAVQLPRALTNEKAYTQHVSPFAPVATVGPPARSAPTSRELENARSRIQSLAKERNYYQRILRKATAIDPKSGKTSLQLLQAENATLRRVNAKQLEDLKALEEAVKENKHQYVVLGDRFNEMAKEMHKAQLELDQLRG
ncbi:unnamed protein product [Penicillium glandicola]